MITTSSPHNFDYVKSMGADKVFDYVRKFLRHTVPLFNIQACAHYSNIDQAGP